MLPAEFAVVGVARQEFGDDEFRSRMLQAIKEFGSEGDSPDLAAWQSFATAISYLSGDFNDTEVYKRLKARLKEIDRERKTQGNYIFYLATAPNYFGVIAQQVRTAGLANEEAGAYRRLIVEKPFGRDLESAKRLNRELLTVFKEEHVYRIDHYLGKETVQNLLVFRFANSIFEPLWNRRYIDSVQFTNAETIGVEGRGAYYEQAGVVRDMIQNHVFQTMSLITMEPPASLAANSVRDEKIKVMQSVRTIPADRVDEVAVRGQYGPGSIMGQRVVGYREEPGVDPNSSTETFAALKIFFDNWRWADVPFYIRSGKRLARRVTEIAIQFKDIPHRLFTDVDTPLEPNVLIIRIQPDEGITLRFSVKLPGFAMRLRPVNMDFRYGSSFGAKTPRAYERLLLDCMLGDSTLYARRDMVERCWEVVMPILESWKQPAPDFPNYEAGTWGPQAAMELLERDGRRWRN